MTGYSKRKSQRNWFRVVVGSEEVKEVLLRK